MAETKDIWNAGAGSFMRIEHTSQKRVLHPLLARAINERAPRHLLDFGCGDGRILELLDPAIAVSVYDNSTAMIEMVTTLMGSKLNGVYSKPDEIPADAFDMVLMSMVVICLKDRQELDQAFELIAHSLMPGGEAIIATSHPCFRQYTFSNFRTSFGKDQFLAYRESALPFQVTIEDTPGSSVTFTDYHWSLADTFNSIIRAGLRISEVIETPDDIDHPRANKGLSAFLIIKAIKP